MTSFERSYILGAIEQSESPTTVIESLRILKNEIIGYDEKKPLWIEAGAVPILVRILKRGHNGQKAFTTRYSTEEISLDLDEDARLQAVTILGSLAKGGPSILPSLVIENTVEYAMNSLDSDLNSPAMVLASLRVLNHVADSLELEQPSADSVREEFLHQVYTKDNILCIKNVLGQQSSKLVVQKQISLAAALINKTCQEDVQRDLLNESGVLEALATQTASFICAGASWSHQKAVSSSTIIPASSKSKLAPILQAICIIISKSEYRANCFVNSQVFHILFGKNQMESSERQPHVPPVLNEISQIAGQSMSSNLGVNARSISHQGLPWDTGASELISKTQHVPVPTSSDSHLQIAAEGPIEHQLGEWLAHVVRMEAGVTRLMASWLLIILYRFVSSDHPRFSSYALLIIPMIVFMMDNDSTPERDTPSSYDDAILQSEEWLTMRYAPSILSVLVEDSVYHQQAAVSAGVIKKLSHLLKQLYDRPPSLFSEGSTSNCLATSSNRGSAAMSSGNGFVPKTVYVLRLRESVLIALAAFATQSDEFRKLIIESGVVSFVIDSLKPFTRADLKDSEGQQIAPGVVGNPTAVLLAACATARALSRSVNTLRTSLIDASLANPVFSLLKHPDLQVQIAATAVVCNLLLEFSPMREPLIAAGVLDILCEHAHSSDVRLRLNAVWGLKHLVNTAPNQTKIKCLEELGAGWLKQIISDVPGGFATPNRNGQARDVSVGGQTGMSTSNAAGQQVNLLNAMDDRTICLFDSRFARVDGQAWNDTANSSTSSTRRFTMHAASERDFKTSIALANEVAVQEQALNLIQNLICGENAAEMIDFLFQEFGQDVLFEILVSRLRPPTPHISLPSNAQSKSYTHSTTGQYPPPEIVKAAVYIVVHIANGSPRHRQLLMSQYELLQLMVPLFSHPDKEVRATCVWLVINLTWWDDHHEKQHCRTRAHEMRKLGILEKLQGLVTDPDLDVKERTKTAMEQVTGLLRGT
ncbi:hypothetical protein MMC25_008146 [Agyrium rufum]|nr:hypothetical protein [Agyrium rufum]